MFMYANIKTSVSGMFRVVQRVLSLRNDYQPIVAALARNITDHSKVRGSQRIKRLDQLFHSREFNAIKMVKAKKYVLVKHFVNDPQPTDLQLVEEELPPLQNEGN